MADIFCSGQFGKNTKLLYSHRQSADVVKLQQKLVELGYLKKLGKNERGYFGKTTLAAVNNYKATNGLWNYGKYNGVVGITTWEHMGLKVNKDYEAGMYIGSAQSYGKGNYIEANGSNLNRGITIGNAQIGIGKGGGDYKYGSWELQTVTADAAAGLSLDYAGINLEGRLVKVEGGFKIPIPYTKKKLFIGGEGSLCAVGFHSYFDKDTGKIKIGASAIVGVGVDLGIVD